MEWEIKIELAKALNNGDNKKVCDIVLNNEMDSQAWVMFCTGVDLTKPEEYRPLLKKMKSLGPYTILMMGFKVFVRLCILIDILEEEN